MYKENLILKVQWLLHLHNTKWNTYIKNKFLKMYNMDKEELQKANQLYQIWT